LYKVIWDQQLIIPTEGYEGMFSIFGVGLTGPWRRKNKCDISFKCSPGSLSQCTSHAPDW